jgi:tRNA (adenine57-N1/adenine58-N1)-methyltransferase
MKIVHCPDRTGTLDEVNFTLSIRGKTYSIPHNLILEAGDKIRVEGDICEILNFNPSLFPPIADRRAQLVQPHDASYIISRCGIGPGSSVIESGVGSGALSAHILWAVGPTGKLVSIDHDAERIEAARSSLSRFFNLKNWASLPGKIENDMDLRDFDVCVLDIPEPWGALGTVRKYVRKGGMVAAYCPNFNQSEKTVTEATKSGFSVLETVEIQLRRIIVREGSTRPDSNGLLHTGFMTFMWKSGNSIIPLE